MSVLETEAVVCCLLYQAVPGCCLGFPVLSGISRLLSVSQFFVLFAFIFCDVESFHSSTQSLNLPLFLHCSTFFVLLVRLLTIEVHFLCSREVQIDTRCFDSSLFQMLNWSWIEVELKLKTWSTLSLSVSVFSVSYVEMSDVRRWPEMPNHHWHTRVDTRKGAGSGNLWISPKNFFFKVVGFSPKFQFRFALLPNFDKNQLCSFHSQNLPYLPKTSFCDCLNLRYSSPKLISKLKLPMSPKIQ